MKLRDRMVYAGIVTSDLKRRHPAHIREFYRDLLHVCDDHGRFEANAVLLRAVLFAPILERVSVRDVQSWLQILHLAGDVTLYTANGRGYGKVTKWRQRRLKVRVAEHPDEDGEMEELPLGSIPLPESPPPPSEKEGRKEGSVSRKRSPAPGAARTHTTTERVLAKDRLDELRAAWPCHDVVKSLRAALRYVRRERGDGAEVELEWFNKFWMPNEPKVRGLSEIEGVAALAEPVNFLAWFRARYEEAPKKPWAELSREQQAYYLKQMGSLALDTRAVDMSNSVETCGGAA